MQLKCHLTLVDGAVFCPRSERWTEPQECSDCEFLQEITADLGEQIVVCRPEVESFAGAIKATVRM
jgi:hypothetical protein